MKDRPILKKKSLPQTSPEEDKGPQVVPTHWISYLRMYDPDGFKDRLVRWCKKSGIPIDEESPAGDILYFLKDENVAALNDLLGGLISDPSGRFLQTLDLDKDPYSKRTSADMGNPS